MVCPATTLTGEVHARVHAATLWCKTTLDQPTRIAVAGVALRIGPVMAVALDDKREDERSMA
jgi:hypothetical protein